MKKILGALLAGALAFGLMGCPTPNNGTTPSTPDTPDTPDTPTTFDGGYWSYVIFELDDAETALTEVTYNVSFGGNPQSGGIGFVDGVLPELKAGETYYVEWDGVGGSTPYVSTRTDKPSLATYDEVLAEDEVAIFVYTTKKKADVYIGDDFGAWPGTKTTPTVAVTEIKAYVDKVTLSGYELEGDAIYFLEAWVPGNTWSAESTAMADEEDVDGNYSFTFEEPAEFTIEEGDELSVHIQIVDYHETEGAGFWEM